MIAAAAATAITSAIDVVPLRGEHAEGDQRRLAGQRDPERLEHHDDEEKRQTVVVKKCVTVRRLFAG